MIRSWPRFLVALAVLLVIGVAFGAVVGWNWLGIVVIGLAILWSLSPLNSDSKRYP